MVRSLIRLIFFGFCVYGLYCIWSTNNKQEDEFPPRRPYDYNKVFRVHETNR